MEPPTGGVDMTRDLGHTVVGLGTGASAGLGAGAAAVGDGGAGAGFAQAPASASNDSKPIIKPRLTLCIFASFPVN